MLPELNKYFNVCTSTGCVLLTVYRFGLFSFSASLYWIMAFKCGSLSSTCEQTGYIVNGLLQPIVDKKTCNHFMAEK